MTSSFQIFLNFWKSPKNEASGSKNVKFDKTNGLVSGGIFKSTWPFSCQTFKNIMENAPTVISYLETVL